MCFIITHARWTIVLKFEHRNLQLLLPFWLWAPFFVLHYYYSAGIHPIPVMRWVLLWVDLSMSSHYSVFLLLGTRAEWQRIATLLAAWHCDRKRGGPAHQPQNQRQKFDPSILRLLTCQEKWRITFQSPLNKVCIDLI